MKYVSIFNNNIVYNIEWLQPAANVKRPTNSHHNFNANITNENMIENNNNRQKKKKRNKI